MKCNLKHKIITIKKILEFYKFGIWERSFSFFVMMQKQIITSFIGNDFIIHHIHLEQSISFMSNIFSEDSRRNFW